MGDAELEGTHTSEALGPRWYKGDAITESLRRNVVAKSVWARVVDEQDHVLGNAAATCHGGHVVPWHGGAATP